MLVESKKTVMHSYPGMVALITSEFNGERNIMAAGWHSYISYEPPIYGVAIGRERYSHKLIAAQKEFAVNFVPAQLAHVIQYSGTYSGSELNKLDELGIEFFPAKTIKAPILKGAYVAYECKVDKMIEIGDHDWVVGAITNFHKDHQYFMEDGLPNFQKLEIPLYLGRSKYLIAKSNSEIKDLVIKK
ncbi:flavin reductase family protein [Bacillus timonensis]|nr:flavin reductase family protein [Bacillus timonensis]